MPEVLLINDGRNQDHFGCHLVMNVLLKAFRPSETIPVFQEPDPKYVRQFDFVIVNAEGSTHHNFKSYLYRDYGVPSAMINAVWQDNDPVDLSHFRYVSARESLSAIEIESFCGVECEVVPDVMLANELRAGSGGGTIVSDSVRGNHGFPVSLANQRAFLEADQIVAGRFHAACLAIATRKAFSAYPSNTHKTKGLLVDAGLAEHYYQTQEAALAGVPDEPDPAADIYLRDARARIQSMIEDVQILAGLRAYRS